MLLQSAVVNVAHVVECAPESDQQDDESDLDPMAKAKCQPHRDQGRESCRDPAQSQVVAERELVARVGGLHSSQMQLAGDEQRTGHSQPKSQFAYLRWTAESGKGHQKAPLARGIDDVATEHPAHVTGE